MEMVGAPVIRVLVPRALPTLLDYSVATPLPVGSWVRIPVGKAGTVGVVVETLASSPFGTLKRAEPLPEVPPLAPPTLAFYRWVARYNLAPPGEGLRAALLRGTVPSLPKRAGKPKALKPQPPVTLHAEQAAAVAAVQASPGFKAWLLDGVTGSGKTEVYIELLRRVLAQGGQALLLVPEIALTPQLLQRVGGALADVALPTANHQPPTVNPVLAWHSGVAEGARKAAWWQVAQSGPAVVVGARSALFLPFQRLQLVLVDEEHDPSYKQAEGFRYHGRDSAVQLAHLWGVPCVLGSATPSLETFQHAQTGKYGRLGLTARHGSAGHAPIALIDLKAAKPAKGQYLSAPLKEVLAATLAKGEQALLFLNRRGNAPLLVCRACGTRRGCPRCSTTLVVHGDRLQCHCCGFTEHYPDECPSCGDTDLAAYGPGTRKVVAEVQTAFPQARVAVADSDALTTAPQVAALVASVAAREVDILVGTQMVVKGHHFPYLTCVGVVDGDMGLAQGEARSAERCFQQLYQVAGRAGRAERPGQVLIQTHDPTHPLFAALVNHQRDTFYQAELAARQAWADSPFGRSIQLQLSGKHEPTVQAAAAALARGFPRPAGVRLLGPAPAPVVKVRDTYRYRLLVKAPNAFGPLQPLVQAWVEATPLPKTVDLMVEVEPL
ncbi:MAG: primosomal protein N' [Alphaproteobacteria bacterium]|nr:primosomal protein N' [Alphaproteobacteria bacterium]